MASSDARTPDQIEADINAVRNRLTNSIEGLIDQVHPNRIKQRTVRDVRSFVDHEVQNAKSLVIYPNGRLRSTRLGIAGGALAGLVTLVLVIKKIASRRPPKPKVGLRVKR